MTNNTSRILGVAFLLQAVTSLISGLILKLALTVPGDISETMINIANNTLLMRAHILGEITTAVGIIFLGAILFVTLRKQNENMALVASESTRTLRRSKNRGAGRQRKT